MSTPTNQQADKKRKPTPRQSQGTSADQAAAAKSTSAAPKPERAAQRPAQSARKTPQTPAKTASQSLPKAGAAPASKAATPAAPKPRDPSVARRDERREVRRLEIQAQQQRRRHELHQAKRQKLLIRYDLIIAPVLLVGLVSLFLVLHQPIDALISGLIIVFGAFTVLTYATVMPTVRTRRHAQPTSPALEEAEVVESSISEDAQPSTDQADAEADNQPIQ